MSFDVNMVILEGTIDADVETRHVGSGDAVVRLRVSTKKKIKKKGSGEEVDISTWHNVEMWNPHQAVSKLAKGDRVSVRGELSTRSYEKDGRKVYVTEIRASSVAKLPPATGAKPAAAPPPPQDTASDDIPF